MTYFEKDGKRIKLWAFCMTLSSSRYAYYELVRTKVAHLHTMPNIYETLNAFYGVYLAYNITH